LNYVNHYSFIGLNEVQVIIAGWSTVNCSHFIGKHMIRLALSLTSQLLLNRIII